MCLDAMGLYEVSSDSRSILACLQTIAVISVRDLGLVQLGSIKKVSVSFLEYLGP